jgi:sulfatase modifying factor 1
MRAQTWLLVGVLGLCFASCERRVVLGDLGFGSNSGLGSASTASGAPSRSQTGNESGRGGTANGGSAAASGGSAASAGTGGAPSGGAGGGGATGAAASGNAGSGGTSGFGAAGSPSIAASGSAGSLGSGGAPTSCVGVAATCGPNGNADCCASNLVPGGTFFRSYDADASFRYLDQSNPATVSDFRLDTYEATVSRLRRFVADYSQTMIAQGAGKNPNNPDDTGWDTAWNADLEASADALISALKCGLEGTWTDLPGSAAAESLPANCLSWPDAEAFCIWDGGRLPTEAEWNYAAAGGSEQRPYAWGSAPLDCTYANFWAPTGPCFGTNLGIASRVGSESPKGDGRYGQADLIGNVWEWVQDYSATDYPNPCDNCANLEVSATRVARGGSFTNPIGDSSERGGAYPVQHSFISGVRCARSAP